MGQRRCSTVLILGVQCRGSTPVFYGFDFEGSTSWVKCRWFGAFDNRVNAVLGALMIGSSAGGLGGLMISLSVYWLKGG